LFEAKIANPQTTKVDEIDPIKALLPTFAKIIDINFRKKL
jgi:hypothetical protein